jgi:hypothetical protein
MDLEAGVRADYNKARCGSTLGSAMRRGTEILPKFSASYHFRKT